MKPPTARYSLSSLYPSRYAPPGRTCRPWPGRGGHVGPPVLFLVGHPDPFGLEGEDRSLGRFLRDLKSWGIDCYPREKVADLEPRGRAVVAFPLEAASLVSSPVQPDQVLDQVPGLALVDAPDQVNATDDAEPLFHAAPEGAGPFGPHLETSAQNRGEDRRRRGVVETLALLDPETIKRIHAALGDKGQTP